MFSFNCVVSSSLYNTVARLVKFTLWRGKDRCRFCVEWLSVIFWAKIFTRVVGGRGTLPKAPHEKTGLRYFNNLNIMFVCMHKLQFGHIMILCNQFNICFHSPFSKQRNCIFSLVSLRPHTAVTFSMVHSPLPPLPRTHTNPSLPLHLSLSFMYFNVLEHSNRFIKFPKIKQ